jgi:hypothetical protein
MKRLDELPPANLMLAVVREVEGCNEPVVVGYGYGSGVQRPRTPETQTPKPKARIYR